MKQNKLKKLTPHKCNNNFENSRKTTIKIFYFLIIPLVINLQSYYYKLLLIVVAYGTMEIS